MRWSWILVFVSWSAQAQIWQPFVLSKDATTLQAGQAAVETGAGYNELSSVRSAILENGAQADTWVSGSVGLAGRLELTGMASAGQVPERGFVLGGARAELRFKVLDNPAGIPLVVTAAGGYQLDWQAQSAAEAALMLSSDLGRFHLAANIRAAHYFYPGRDPMDLSVSAGAAYRVTSWFQAGAEYQGQELEGLNGGTDADLGGGGRQFVGPSLTVLAPGTPLRLSVTGGPVATSTSVGLLVRGSLAYVF